MLRQGYVNFPTLFEHADFEALCKATCLASLPASLGDLTHVGCWTAVFYVSCEGCEEGKINAIKIVSDIYHDNDIYHNILYIMKIMFRQRSM